MNSNHYSIEEHPLYRAIPLFFYVCALLATYKPPTSCHKVTLSGLVRFDNVTPKFGSMVGRLHVIESNMV